MCVFAFLVPRCDVCYNSRLKDVQLVFTSIGLFESSCLIYVICVSLRILSCVSNVTIFSGLIILDFPFGFSNVYLYIMILTYIWRYMFSGFTVYSIVLVMVLIWLTIFSSTDSKKEKQSLFRCQICPTFVGRSGNQMFIFASSYSIALYKGMILQIERDVLVVILKNLVYSFVLTCIKVNLFAF